MPALAGAAAREIHFEETNWRARPDFSPDGNRVVFASYDGARYPVLDNYMYATTAYPDWNDAAEKAHVMQQLVAAKAVYLSLH